MDVFVMTLNDATVTIPVRPSDRIDDVLRKIDDAAGVQVGPSSLVHNGVYMAGDRTIGDYGIRGGSTLYQVLRVRGGADADGDDVDEDDAGTESDSSADDE
ncbi:hypothetical protein M885DRAFT_420773, partial [Pelagophyceae sp. CCMP2097]